MRFGVLFQCLSALVFVSGLQAGSLQRAPAADAPEGLAQFGRLVGDWYIEQQVRQADGSWQSTGDAEWNFRYALGGYAIQDQWVQPPEGAPLIDGESRQYGTNLRIYDSEGDRWRIVWASSDQPTFTEYEATTNERGELMMIGDDRERPGVTQKITYFDISENGWNWKMEFSRNGQEWVEVARIQARPMRRE